PCGWPCARCAPPAPRPSSSPSPSLPRIRWKRCDPKPTAPCASKPPPPSSPSAITTPTSPRPPTTKSSPSCSSPTDRLSGTLVVIPAAAQRCAGTQRSPTPGRHHPTPLLDHLLPIHSLGHPQSSPNPSTVLTRLVRVTKGTRRRPGLPA